MSDKRNYVDESTKTVAENLGSIGMFSSGRSNFSISKVETETAINGKYVFHLRNRLGKRESITVYNNEDFINLQTIENIKTVTERADLAKAYHLAKLNNKESLQSMGVKSIADIGYGCFEIQRGTANQYARIGKLFVSYSEERGYYLSNPGLPEYLTVSHIIEFLSYINKYIEQNKEATEDDAINQIVDYYLNGDLRDGMSTKEIRKALKSLQNEVKEEGTSPESETRSEGTSPESETRSEGTSPETETRSEEVVITRQQELTNVLYTLDEMEKFFTKNDEFFREVGKQVNALQMFSYLKECVSTLIANNK